MNGFTENKTGDDAEAKRAYQVKGISCMCILMSNNCTDCVVENMLTFG